MNNTKRVGKLFIIINEGSQEDLQKQLDYANSLPDISEIIVYDLTDTETNIKDFNTVSRIEV